MTSPNYARLDRLVGAVEYVHDERLDRARARATVLARWSLLALRTLLSLRSWLALSTLRSRWTLRAGNGLPGRSWRSCGADSSLLALRPGHRYVLSVLARRTLRSSSSALALLALRTYITGRSDASGITGDSLGALLALSASETRTPVTASRPNRTTLSRAPRRSLLADTARRTRVALLSLDALLTLVSLLTLVTGNALRAALALDDDDRATSRCLHDASTVDVDHVDRRRW